jgi:pyruvate dehydrogenase E2 component (dihydrolipoamide acetyltransferase)
MEEGTILRWLKAEGDTVARGEELCEIETDKATMTYESDSDGVLHIIAAEGTTLPIGQPIAVIGDGSPPAAEAPSANGASSDTPLPTIDAPDIEPPADDKRDDAPATAPPQAPVAAYAPDGVDEPAKSPPAPASSGERVKASPVARRIARERGVDLAGVTGTGPGGRIVRSDVEGAPVGAAPSAPDVETSGEPITAPTVEAPTPTPVPPAAVTRGEAGTAKGEVTVQELTRGQQVVARRMAEAKATVPEFTLQAEIDMEGAVALRSQLKKLAAEGTPVPSYNDMVVKACGLALSQHPRANGAYRDGRFELHQRVNVGVAVAAPDSLVVPTVFDADSKSLGEIARETRALAERVRAGAITPPELSGGTFTVSNLGMYGVSNFTAIVNPPQAAILAVGELKQRAVVRDGELVARHTMHVTLACDHRILYGADAALFLARVRELLEEPLALAL